MRTITCDDEAATWSRSDHLMGAMFPSSDDSNSYFSRTPQRTRTEIMVNLVSL
jgi:hypothetical protein